MGYEGETKVSAPFKSPDPHKMLGSLPEELQLTEMAKFVAYVSREPMACCAYRNRQIQLLCCSA